MDVEELKILAKSMGYNIIPIKKREKLLSCICGCNRREHWVTYIEGIRYEKLICERCGKFSLGKSEAKAIHNWNEMIRSEQDGCKITESKNKI